jgi:thiol-disulfide isomerase/thioredoxin
VTKRVLLTVVVLASFLWIGLGFSPTDEPPVGDPGASPSASALAVASLSLPALEGGAVRFAELRGKVVLVDFWATWCPPCRAMIPSLNRLQAKYRDQGLVIVGVSVDEGGANDVLAFREWQPLDYTVALGDGQAVSAFGGIDALPTSFLLDRDGKIRAKHVGYTSEEQLEAEIARLLAE